MTFYELAADTLWEDFHDSTLESFSISFVDIATGDYRIILQIIIVTSLKSFPDQEKVFKISFEEITGLNLIGGKNLSGFSGSASILELTKKGDTVNLQFQSDLSFTFDCKEIKVQEVLI